MADFVAHVLHEQEEVAQVVGVRYGGAQILLQHGAEGGLAPGPAQPLNVADRLGGLPLEENGQAALPAQAIRYGPDLSVVALGIAVVLFAGICVDRVKEDVGVDVLFVYMDADDRLVAGQVLFHTRSDQMISVPPQTPARSPAPTPG